MEKVKIRDIEISHGKNIINNEYYLEHFKKQGKDIKHFLEDVMGRKDRYEIDRDTENALTMAIEASLAVLKKSNLVGKDIDMIVYSGTLSEYASPISAVFIHHAINGKAECFCHDMNVNCIGMTYAFDMVSRYISTNPNINKVLLVGSDTLSLEANPNNEQTYGQFADVACAIICERTHEDCQLISTKMIVNSDYTDYVRFPSCGFSHIYDAPKEEIYTKFNSSGPWWMDGAIQNINSILDENGLTINDVSMFCFTQIAYKNISIFRERLGIPEERSLFVGDVYGYTGTSSPFLVLYEGIKNEQVKRGDYVILFTVGGGGYHITELIKY